MNKSETVLENWKVGDLRREKSKGFLSIVTTPRCRVGCYSFPWIAPLYPWSVPYNAECYARRHQVAFFESSVWLDLGLNPGLPDHWRTLLTTMPMARAEIILEIETDLDNKTRTSVDWQEKIKEIKKNLPSSVFCCSGGQQSENIRKWEDWQILWSCQRTKKKSKPVEHESDGHPPKAWKGDKWDWISEEES